MQWAWCFDPVTIARMLFSSAPIRLTTSNRATMGPVTTATPRATTMGPASGSPASTPDLLQVCAVGPDWVDGPSQRGRRWCGWHDAGQGVQGPAVHGRGDPVGRALVSDVPDQLSRSRADAAGPWRRGGPHDHLPLDPGLCARAGEADPAAPTPEQRLVAG